MAGSAARLSLLLAFVAILVVAALASNWFEKTRSAEQEYAVYSAYLSEAILNDPHDWQSAEMAAPAERSLFTTRRMAAFSS